MTASPLETLVTVFGGSGFLGRHVVRALAKRGYRIRVAVRRPDLAGHLQPLGRVGQIHAVQANLRYPGSVEAAARDADVVDQSGRHPVRARPAAVRRGAGLRRRGGGAGGGGLRRAAHPRLGDRRRRRCAVALCALARRWARSWCSPPCRDATILRPSIVFGPEDDFFNQFAAIARISPALPLIGGGHTRFQPVFAGDVASRGRWRAIEGRAAPGAIYELGGPEVQTFKELMQFVLATIERRRLLVPLPFALAQAAGLLPAVPAEAAA